MRIEPIGVGFSGMYFGGGSYGGMSVYRRNSLGKGAGQYSAAGGTLVNGTQKNGTVYGNTPTDGTSVWGTPKDGTKNGRISEEADRKRRFDSFECQTCKNRKYQDGSDDSGVSFQTPTRVDPRAAASKVRSHEQEHVSRNQAKAEREGNEIVAQSVTIHTGICPECGKVYVSGGTTRTITKSGSDSAENNYGNRYSVGMSDPTAGRGELLNMSA